MTNPRARRLPSSLEELLLGTGCLTPEAAIAARRVCDENGVNFGSAVMFLELVPVETIAGMLKVHAGIRHVSVATLALPAGVKNLLSPDQAKALEVFPLGLIDDSGQKIVLLGMTDPLASAVTTKVQLSLGISVQPAFLSLSDLQVLYKKYYRSGLPLFPVQVTTSGEGTVSRRIEAVVREPQPSRQAPAARVSAEVRALVRCLEARGLITEAEYRHALDKER